MVNYCRVVGCYNRSDRDKNLKFYRLPKVITNQGEECRNISEERRRMWLAKLNQNFSGKNLENIRVCSAHFISGKRADLYRKNDPDWVPSVNMMLGCGRSHQRTRKMEYLSKPEEAKRCKRRKNALQKNLEKSAAESLLLLNKILICTSGIKTEDIDCKGTQTELTGDMML